MENKKETNARWRNKNRERYRELARQGYHRRGGSLHKNIDPRVRYRKLREVSNRKFGTFDITFEQYSNLVSKPCFYCNADLSKSRGYSIDRIDNAKGYLIDNIIQCCGDCNVMRGDKFTHEEMVVAIKAILQYRISKLQ